MPNRIAHEKACNSPTLDQLSDGAERLFWRAMTKADDYGRFDADPRALLGACFPLRIGKMPVAKVMTWRDELVAAGAWALYQAAGRLYGYFKAWADHQRARESKPKFPDPATGTPFDPFDPEARGGPEACGELPRVAAIRRESRLARAGMHARPSGVVNRESLTERRESDANGFGGESPPAAARLEATASSFKIPDAVARALDRAPRLGSIKALRNPAFWQAQVRACPGVDFPDEVLKAEAWMAANPQRAARRDYSRFLHNWLVRAKGDRPA